MADHTGLPVLGYQPQSPETVLLVNGNKEMEELILRFLDALRVDDNEFLADKRWLAVARTHFEEGFMALNRSIFKPKRAVLQED